MIFPLLAAVWLGTLLLRLTVGAAVLLCVGYTFWHFLGLSLTSAVRVLGPRRAGVPDPRIPRFGAGETAHRAYWSRQMWLDGRSAADGALGALRHRLVAWWFGRTVRNLLGGRRPGGSRGRSPLNRTVLRLTAPAAALGASAGALLAALLVSAVLAVLALLLGVVYAAGAATALALRRADALGLRARSVRMKCPHPGCYRPFPLAVHTCPNCDTAHAALRPGRYGALWHTCGCGLRLATTALARRSRLTMRCPHCAQDLPGAVAGTRVVHLPLVGGTSAGKTMLLAAMVAGLQSFSRGGPLTLDYASTTDQRNTGSLNQQLNSTGWALKTQGGQPRALMLSVGRGMRRRLLYLYDPMGESLRDAGSVREQHYLAHADGVILVADVLAEPQVRRALDDVDRLRAAGARPAEQGPLDTYQRLTGELAALTGRRRRLPVAVVITKRDTLDRLESLPVPPDQGASGEPGAPLESWLTEIGLGALVRGLRHDFGTVRYWSVSAHAATGAGALDSEQRRAAAPVLWLLSRSGLRVAAAAGK
ncbi:MULTISPECIES: TRAFAC clade GTPase domain-containing protein [unclassified Streptomyces]|uniref:TRAFAC clade GTPase domain-containing protein n=1 Tax=unclassified Streptomyces TaxID=2593676 RepID=UPI002E2B77B2|nr:hypothetical protein [Streptomyces sp. NBC_01429]